MAVNTLHSFLHGTESTAPTLLSFVNRDFAVPIEWLWGSTEVSFSLSEASRRNPEIRGVFLLGFSEGLFLTVQHSL